MKSGNKLMHFNMSLIGAETHIPDRKQHMKHSLILLMFNKSFTCLFTCLTLSSFESLKCLGSFVPWYDAHALQTPRRDKIQEP